MNADRLALIDDGVGRDASPCVSVIIPNYNCSRWLKQTINSRIRQRPALNEFYRKKVYRWLDPLQTDLDAWLREYNESRPHQGRWCFGKTSMQPFLDALPIAKEKMIAV
jgi:hypothetical protein